MVNKYTDYTATTYSTMHAGTTYFKQRTVMKYNAQTAEVPAYRKHCIRIYRLEMQDKYEQLRNDCENSEIVINVKMRCMFEVNLIKNKALWHYRLTRTSQQATDQLGMK